MRALSASLLPAIHELCSDKSWRVRLTTVSFLPKVAAQLGADCGAGAGAGSAAGSAELTDLILAGLSDPVFSIREVAAANLGRLAASFGSAWAEAAVIPRVLAMIEAGRGPGVGRPGGAAGYGEALASTVPPSQLRMTGLLALLRLGEALGREAVAARVLPAVLQLAGDAVPNVRFNAAKALGVLARCVEPAVAAARVRPVIARLREDADQDVRFFAGQVAF